MERCYQVAFVIAIQTLTAFDKYNVKQTGANNIMDI